MADIAEVLSPEQLAALRLAHQRLVSAGDPRADKVGAYLQSAQLAANNAVIAARQAGEPQGGALGRFGRSLYESTIGAVPGLLDTAGSAMVALSPGLSMIPGLRETADEILGRNVVEPVKAQAKQAMDPSLTGMERVGHGLATLPLIGPVAAGIGERAGSGDIAGAIGSGTGLALARTAPEWAPSVARGTVRAAKAGAGSAAEILPFVLRPKTSILKLAAQMAKERAPVEPVSPAFNMEGLPQPVPPAPVSPQPFNMSGLPQPTAPAPTPPAPAMPFNLQGLPQPPVPVIPPVQAGPFNLTAPPSSATPPAAPPSPGLFNMTGITRPPKGKPVAPAKAPASQEAPPPPPPAAKPAPGVPTIEETTIHPRYHEMVEEAGAQNVAGVKSMVAKDAEIVRALKKEGFTKDSQLDLTDAQVRDIALKYMRAKDPKAQLREFGKGGAKSRTAAQKRLDITDSLEWGRK